MNELVPLLVVIGLMVVMILLLFEIYLRRHHSTEQAQPWRFDVCSFGATGNGEVDDTSCIQDAIKAAEAYVLAHNTAAEVFFPPGVYLVTSTLSVKESSVNLVGVGTTGDTWTTKGSTLQPAPAFADDTYVLAFDWVGKDKNLYNNHLENINIMTDAPFDHAVHGIFWGVTKGVMSHVHVEGMSGRGLGIAGHSAKWRAHDNYFCYSSFRYSGTHGIEILKSESDNWWHMCKSEGNVHGAGLCGLGANDYFDACHFTGNLNNVYTPTGGSEAAFVACNFETPSQHNVLLDVTGGGISRVRFIGCHFNSNRLDAGNVWDNLHVGRTSGKNRCSGVIMGCTMTHQAEEDLASKPRYHIYLSEAAYFFNIGPNMYSGAETGNIFQSAAAQLCLVNGLGRNKGDPNVVGDWFGKGDEGLRVFDVAAGLVYEYRDGAWRL